MRSVDPKARAAIQLVGGATLVDVGVTSDYVELAFLGDELRVLVRITKQFAFVMRDRAAVVFNPSFDRANPPGAGCGDFVLLQGDRCVSASLEESILSIVFESGSRISLTLDENDFEPLSIIGMDGDRNEKLAFYHVL